MRMARGKSQRQASAEGITRKRETTENSPPNTTELVVANLLVPSSPQSLSEIPLLLYREQDITLNSENQGRYVLEVAESLCEVVEVRRVAGEEVAFWRSWRSGRREEGVERVGFGSGEGVKLVSTLSDVDKGRGRHVEEVHRFGDVDEGVGVVLEAPLLSL